MTFWEKNHYAQSIAELHSIEISLIARKRHQTPPKHFEHGVILETTVLREHLSCSNDHKTTIYFPVIDAFHSENSRRFNKKNVDIMRAIHACNPLAKSFLSLPALLALVETR